MKSFKKVFSLLLLMFLFPVVGGIQAVSADETTDNVQVTLHKLLFKDGDLPNITQNNGKTNPFGTTNPELLDYVGLNDVTFEVYDVTETYYRLLKDGVTSSEARNQLINTDEGTKVGEAITKTVAGEDGIAVFSLPRKDAKGNFKVYRFVEASAPKEYVDKAGVSAPLVVTLPITDNSEKELTDIHLYPKNEQTPYETPELEKKVTTNRSDFELGVSIPYEITTTIPYDIWSYQHYALEDKGNKALSFNQNSLKVTADGKAFTDYVLKATEHGFTLNFTPVTLKAYAGKKLKVDYTMTLKNADQGALANNAILYPGNHEVVKDKTTIYTGGKQFLKVNLKDQDTVLADAKFVIRNNKGEYLLQKDEKNHWKKITGDVTENSDKLSVFISDEKGLFAVKGLSYGTYELVEIAAPHGFTLSQQAVEFKVDAESFPTADALPLKVVNEPSPLTPPSKRIPTDKQEITNKPVTSKTKSNLPQTGEKVVKGFGYLGVGLIVLALGIYLYKKTEKRKQNEKQDAK